MAAARWIERDGQLHGFRAPTPEERARVTGRGDYLLALGLSPRGLFDLVGDHFDPDALLLRLRCVYGWLRGGQLPPPPAAAPGPHAILRAYATLRRAVLANGVPAEETPYPRDMRATLLAETDDLAAPGGRGDR